jgi:hypothetical protein
MSRRVSAEPPETHFRCCTGRWETRAATRASRATAGTSGGTTASRSRSRTSGAPASSDSGTLVLNWAIRVLAKPRIRENKTGKSQNQIVIGEHGAGPTDGCVRAAHNTQHTLYNTHCTYGADPETAQSHELRLRSALKTASAPARLRAHRVGVCLLVCSNACPCVWAVVGRGLWYQRSSSHLYNEVSFL